MEGGKGKKEIVDEGRMEKEGEERPGRLVDEEEREVSGGRHRGGGWPLE